MDYHHDSALRGVMRRYYLLDFRGARGIAKVKATLKDIDSRDITGAALPEAALK